MCFLLQIKFNHHVLFQRVLRTYSGIFFRPINYEILTSKEPDKLYGVEIKCTDTIT